MAHDNYSDGERRLAEIADRIKSRQQVASISVRDLLSWFGARQRGFRTNQSIRKALRDNGLDSTPTLLLAASMTLLISVKTKVGTRYFTELCPANCFQLASGSGLTRTQM